MPLHLLLIANPAAARGRAALRARRLVSALSDAGSRVELVWTQRPGHAREIAAAAHNVDAVIAAGGDGTAHEVASGMLAAGVDAHFGVAPLGSGNDFARMLGMAREAGDITRQLLKRETRLFDYGEVTWQTADSSGSDVFINALGCGFDAFVAEQVRHTQFGRGLVRYLVTALRCLRRWHGPRVVVEGDDGAFRWRDSMLLCTAGIGVSSGGGFHLTPRARPDDGLFDVCVARTMPIHRILRVLPLALGGRHLAAPEVAYGHARTLRLRADQPVPLHLDGEVVASDVLSLEARIVPAGLRVLTGLQEADGEIRRHR